METSAAAASMTNEDGLSPAPIYKEWVCPLEAEGREWSHDTTVLPLAVSRHPGAQGDVNRGSLLYRRTKKDCYKMNRFAG